MEVRSSVVPRVLLCGIDTVEGSAYEAVSPGIKAVLPSWKDGAQRAEHPYLVRLAGEPFRVLPRGIRAWRFVLEHERGHYLNPDTGNSKRPTLQIKMRAEALHGPDGAAGELAFREAVILPELFNRDTLEVPLMVSRGDVHADAAGVRFSADDTQGFVGRPHAIAWFQDLGTTTVSGFKFGARGAPVYGRLYDKLRHISESGESEYLLELYGNAGLNADEPVWRLEFEFRRQALVEADIRTVRDFINRDDDLWRYGSVEWLRLT